MQLLGLALGARLQIGGVSPVFFSLCWIVHILFVFFAQYRPVRDAILVEMPLPSLSLSRRDNILFVIFMGPLVFRPDRLVNRKNRMVL